MECTFGSVGLAIAGLKHPLDAASSWLVRAILRNFHQPLITIMSLTDQINTDLKAAMKSGDQVRLNAVRSIRALLIELSKRGTGTVTPEDELTALLAAAKKRKEAIELYDAAGRKDLADIERTELSVIQIYLPQPMSKEDAASVVTRIVTESGALGMKDMGKVMPAAMKELKGKIDGGIIQELVKTRLGGGS